MGAKVGKELTNSSILSVDDDLTVTRTMTRVLGKLSVPNVYTAGSVTEGLEVIEEHGADIDAALIDFRMPKRHGLELVKLIRTGNTKARHDMPCLMLTAHVDPSLLGLAMTLDADAFLNKPATAQELNDNLSRILANPPLKKAPGQYEQVEIEDSLDDLVKRLAGGGTPYASQVITGKEVDLGKDKVPEDAVLFIDLVNKSGQTILPKGTELDPGKIALLKNLMEFDPSIRTIYIAP